MKKIVSVVLTVSSLIFFNCEKESTNFKITNSAIGQLTKETKISDLETLYANDSIVAANGIPKMNLSNVTSEPEDDNSERVIKDGFSYQKIEVFEKGGAHLLSLTPSNDSVPTVENIRIYDARYKTEKGVTINSTFKDIKDNYTIKKIITTMNNVVILLKDSGVYFTIDKQQLPASLRYNSSTNIEEVQIPDTAKIKYMWMAWE
ncbi:hypothetical protein KO500_11285 [Cellulophaga baltica]|uniref:hypothetical protein n=1 Tax=Cellulophaga TaxID=104264 RepID=UPI001C068FD6|nr:MULTISPECIES: hypothetical protein [Cellulophaga]MBU2997021.1 hypothetical protein [Cellulophaga baltica]MDO6768419.1 hypothetical protein [Cellulophaga sp. 1_MG-2023]